jgi:TetR/AcrR family transcriptional repressor of nem operon
MGHSKASKAQTRARLVEVAAARFKELGIDGISLSDLMKELQLTHGGFYKHFESRDELVKEALAATLAEGGRAMRERLLGGDAPDIAGFVDFYLGRKHRDSRAAGCAVAALAGDAARNGEAVQTQFREQIERNLELLTEVLRVDSTPDDARARAVLLLSELYGALTMARAVGDSALSGEILRTVRDRILGSGASAAKPHTTSETSDAPKPQLRKRRSAPRHSAAGRRHIQL